MKFILKKSIITSLLTIATILFVSTNSYGTTGKVTATSLNVRKDASKNADIITTIPKEKEVEIVSTVGDEWYKVTFDNITGYVSSEYIQKQEKQVETTTEQANESQQENTANEEKTKEENNDNEDKEDNKNKILVKGTKVYITPLINANVIQIQEKNIEVEVITKLNGWAYIYSDSLNGWVRSDKLYNEDELKTKAYISTSSVNLRKEPNKTADTMLVMSRNAEVKVIIEDGEWTKIEYLGKVGYVLSQYLSENKVEITSRNSVNRRNVSTITKQNNSNNTAKNETKTNNTETNNVQEETKVAATNTELGQQIVDYAKTFLGGKYVYGGTTPAGFDCSGFTQYVFKHFGYSLSRTAASQASNGTAISTSSLQIGDLLCFSNSSNSTKIGHVGIYIGGGKFVHAANSRKGIITSNVNGAGFYLVKARRII